MTNFKVVSYESHSKKRWKHYASYAFAAQHAVMQLVGAELPNAMMAMPLGFVEHGDGYVPVAIMGLQPGRNLFVAPNGCWLGKYVPAVFRSYPFLLAKSECGQKMVLSVDDDSDLLAEGPAEGEAFFSDDGQPSPAITELMAFLVSNENNRAITVVACDVLKKHRLIHPWPIALQSTAGAKQLTGLFKIDEVALNALSDEAFLELRWAGAIPLAYCQLMSMQHLPMLGRLADDAHPQAIQPLLTSAMGDFDLEFLNGHGTISFSNLD